MKIEKYSNEIIEKMDCGENIVKMFDKTKIFV